MKGRKSKAIITLACIISLLVIVSGWIGIFADDLYVRETPDWRIQSIGQDKINLFIIVPVLLISGIKSNSKKINYKFIFCGCLLFLIYTFTVYCFDIHFNSMFLIYCLILGISFYSFIYVFYQLWLQIGDYLHRVQLPVRSLRIFLFVTTLIFCFLWLREDLTAILLAMPSVSLTDAGLFTNPVHVLDLAFVLPGFCIVAQLLKKDMGLGKMLVPCILIFSTLMVINMIVLVIMTTKITEALFGVTGSMILFALAIFLLLRIVFRRFRIIQLESGTLEAGGRTPLL